MRFPVDLTVEWEPGLKPGLRPGLNVGLLHSFQPTEIPIVTDPVSPKLLPCPRSFAAGSNPTHVYVIQHQYE